MTLRDEIIDVMKANVDERGLYTGFAADAILALVQPRFDEIKDLCRISGSRLNSFREGCYPEVDDTKKEIDEIYDLCTLDPPPAKPGLAVGQTWEKAPTHRCRIIAIHSNDDGKQFIIVENRAGYVDVMQPETFERYRLVKDGDV